MSTSISRMNTLIILEILKKHSSLEKPLTNSAIMSLAQNELKKIRIIDDAAVDDSSEGKSKANKISTSTVQRILDELADLCFNYPSFAKLLGGSVRILLLDSIPGKSRFHIYNPDHDDPDEESSGTKRSLAGKTRYYCFDPVLSTEEINILATSIAANPFLSLEQNQTLNKKIMDMFPIQLSATDSGSSKQTIIPRTVEHNREHMKHEKLLANITFLLARIRSNLRVKVNYGKYDLEKHDLVSRSDNKFSELEPVTIAWSNGFAYLLAIKPGDYQQSDLSSQIYHYRIDRIIEIRDVIDNTGKPVTCTCIQKLGNNLDILEYQKQHPVMYGGKKQRITFLAKDYEDAPLANLLVDTFGLEYLIQKAGPNDGIYLGELFAENPDSWYRISVNATALGTELWAMQHADRVRILSPDSVVSDMQNRLLAAIRLNQPLS